MVTLAPAGTVIVLLSKAMFRAARSMVMLWKVVGMGVGVEPGIGVGVAMGVGAGVDEHAARTDRVIINIKTSRCLRLTEKITFIIFPSNLTNTELSPRELY